MAESAILRAASLIKKAKYTIAFTGAGISVESGIPPFRGENGIWNRYDPKVLDLDYFYNHPYESWVVIKEIFYDFFGKAQPNDAHKVLGRFEKSGLLECVITQNIDNLHQEGGCTAVHEFHGNSQVMECTACKHNFPAGEANLKNLPVQCPLCGGLVKPGFVFFGEAIPREAYDASILAARRADICLVIGSLGEVMPASMVPHEAKRNGAVIIEINPKPSNFTASLTDIHLTGKASQIMLGLETLVNASP